MLVGTGISLLGAKAGWDPRLTALASMAGGGIAGGMASGAFGSAAGSAAGAAAPGVGMTGSLFPAGTTAGTATLGGITQPAAGGLFGGSTPTVIGSNLGAGASMTGAGWAAPGASSSLLTPIGNNGLVWGNPNLTGIQPVFDPLPLSAASLSGVTQPTMSTPAAQSGFSKWITGPQGKALGADMLKTFLDYEIALANEPPQRLSSGGGGGGGGGRAPAYPGGGQTGQKSVVWSYPQATGMYQPKPLA